VVSPDGADRSPASPGRPATGEQAPPPPARYRYGVVLGLTILAVLFSILAPETPVGRAFAVLLQGAMLFATIATSREEGEDLRRREPAGVEGRWGPRAHTSVAALTLAAIIAVAVLVGLKAVPRWVGSACTVVAVFAVLVVLLRGVVRLIRVRGVTVQAVAGALAIYLLIGLEFALVVRVLVGVLSHPYFAQVANAAVTQSQEIYFSFTTLTTTGYGDFTPQSSPGRALSVLEMLLGQIYLVTVIGLLVGNLRRGVPGRPGE
jgi:hypothetical protein